MSEAASHNLQRTVDEITGYRKRTRKLVIGLIAVTVVAVVLAVAAVYLYIRQHDSNVGNCVAGNQTRIQQEQLWNTLFTLASKNTSGTPPTAKTVQLTKEFLGDVKKTYAPVDCGARYPFW
jgi:hypothetical protein